MVVQGKGFDNLILLAALVIGVIGFCAYHWRAYKIHIVREGSIESMVLSSLKGSTFVAILFSGGAALQAVQIMCLYLLRPDHVLDAGFGERLAAIVVLLLLTGVFCVIFWLLKVIRPATRA